MCSLKRVQLIGAQCRGGGIGKDGKLPWRLPKEMNFFTRITSASADGKRNAVIMGRKSWESIPDKYRPLPNRINVVLSSTLTQLPSRCDLLFDSLPKALQVLSAMDEVDKVFVIGGERAYAEAMKMEECERIYLTKLDAHFDCDAHFPPVDEQFFSLTEDENVDTTEQEENGIRYKFHVYSRKP
jgi:dihydrofolate reductase